MNAPRWTRDVRVRLQAPVALAEEIGILDWLSGGRIEVGLGLGHRVEELEALGVDPAKRIPVFQERAALLQALWTGGAVSIDSEFTTIKGAAISPLPPQQPLLLVQRQTRNSALHKPAAQVLKLRLEDHLWSFAL